MNAFVDRMVCDHWSGVFCEEIEIASPTPDDINREILSLNAVNRTMTTLFGHLGAYLCVGGGGGKYIVYASTSDGEIWNLMSNDIEHGEAVLLNIGGQEGEYSPSQIVDVSLVQKVVANYWATGQLEESLKWKKQN